MKRLSETTARSCNTVWKAGIYARLSVDHDNRKNESIDTQIQIAKAYIDQTDDIEAIECYTDLGKTGTSFKRDGFEKMMADVRQKKINCIVVKDLSRFGRNYIETGNYMEKIFPFLKVRFIAVTDGYDSEHVTADHVLLSVNLKNIVNELYARDISWRVKASMRLRQEKGNYTGGIPPYGYRVEQTEDKKILVPDAATKGIVVRIFELYADEKTFREIAEELYQRRIQRPTVYYRTKEVYAPEGGDLQQWPFETLKWILTNPVYIGTLFQARTGGKVYWRRRRHEVNDEDVTILEHMHEPLISESLFYLVSSRFERQRKYANTKGFSRTVPKCEDIFKGKVFCGECGRLMVRNSAVKTLSSGDRMHSYYYFCPNIRKIDDRACRNQGISPQTLEGIIKPALKKEFAFSGIRQKDYCMENEKEAKKRKNIIKKKKDQIVQDREKLILEGSAQYLQYRMGRINRETFLEEKKKMDEQQAVLTRLEEELEQKERGIDQEIEKMNRFLRGLIKCRPNVKLNRELVECLINRIYIYSGHHVEIIFNYRKNDLFFMREAYESGV